MCSSLMKENWDELKWLTEGLLWKVFKATDLRSLQLPQIKPHIQSDSFENDPRQPITEAIGLPPSGGQSRKQMLSSSSSFISQPLHSSYICPLAESDMK